ncbi:MAG: carboxy-S-adenosyl-L-methionine synthase CmoA [Psittacicella sp.]
MKNKDTIFKQEMSSIEDFSFNENISNVFYDMARRSIPGYEYLIKNIGEFSKHFIQNNSNIYDLGCSIGDATLSISQNIDSLKLENINIIGIDLSSSMSEKAKINLNNYKLKYKPRILTQDILKTEIKDASFVVLNFTMQFIKPTKREDLLKNIFNNMLPGSALIISEKVLLDDPFINEFLVKKYYDFKKVNGYSSLEINQKRIALENVMQLDSLDIHLKRLTKIGFKANSWFQNLNFISFIAIK